MKYPLLSAPTTKPKIEAVFQKMAAHFEEERRLREQLGYLEVEREGLEAALQMAREHPESKHEVWNWLSYEFKGMNQRLAEMDAPPLRCVSLETFVAFLRAEIAKDPAQ